MEAIKDLPLPTALRYDSFTGRLDDYTLLRTEESADYWEHKHPDPYNERFWSFSQSSLSAGTVLLKQQVQLRQPLSVQQLSRWEIASANATQLINNSPDLRKLLPKRGIFDFGQFGFGFLGQSTDRRYVMSFMNNAIGVPGKCAFGFIRYRVWDNAAEKVAHQRDCCFHEGHGEFSGFVTDSEKLCYLILRQASLDDDKISGTEELLCMDRNGNSDRRSAPGIHKLCAAPNGNRIALLYRKNPPATAVLEMRTANLDQLIWRRDVANWDFDSRPLVDLLWSEDEAMVTLGSGDGHSNTTLLLFSAVSGDNLGECRLPFARLRNGACAIVKKDERADFMDLFGIEQRSS